MRRTRLRRDTDKARAFADRRSELRSDPEKVRELVERSRQRSRGRLEKQRRVELMCVVCGGTFAYTFKGEFRRKTCSQKCANNLRRRANGDRRGKRNPNYRHGARAGDRDRENEQRWYAGLAERCEGPVCPTPKGGTRGLALHHVVYRQHVRAAKGDIWDSRNGLTLCDSCHMSHHRRGRVIPIAALPDVALEFGFQLLGAAAVVYFERYYAGADERLVVLERTYPAPSPQATPGEAHEEKRRAA